MARRIGRQELPEGLRESMEVRPTRKNIGAQGSRIYIYYVNYGSSGKMGRGMGFLCLVLNNGVRDSRIYISSKGSAVALTWSLGKRMVPRHHVVVVWIGDPVRWLKGCGKAGGCGRCGRGFPKVMNEKLQSDSDLAILGPSNYFYDSPMDKRIGFSEAGSSGKFMRKGKPRKRPHMSRKRPKGLEGSDQAGSTGKI
ncbi:unnamed protein product [Arabis nemorensis]|uniref:Uncharacterized protein n=1 Tax=Arabis nemorensis TaxID=586526 RepID=A0A565C4K5_9BRAS|nr:unnamed protein product [Arabis nemorensis]